MVKRIRSQIARGSALRFTLASLYAMLYGLEKRGWIEGRWEANRLGRDRRYYGLTPAGGKQLAPLRREWATFFQALDRLASAWVLSPSAPGDRTGDCQRAGRAPRGPL
jgi:DNA-binding PadR family transcriptional regulator